jgi:8-oxo-dGTP diphosphatase
MINRFNVRVYFILFDDSKQRVLVSDERIAGGSYTKFPGGGLEFGEGPEDCVLREAMEELGQQVEVISHLYTTGFFIPSAFRETDQVISIYYIVKLCGPQIFRTSDRRFDFLREDGNEESFRWVVVSGLSEEHFHFPADLVVAVLIAENN